MLAPESRALLTDALRPPDGFRVDVAVATTYSMDLVALLLAPLSFALQDPDTREPERIDPIRLIEAVRRYADRTTVFCQAGAIHLPSSYRSVLTFVEESVREVRPPSPEHLFHPKIWLVRFAARDGRTLHRFLCLSRNLTFDSSWDTMLRLDEIEDGGPGVSPDPAPLADFVEHLPELCVRPLDPGRAQQLAGLAKSTRDVHFGLPDGFDGVRFCPLGTPGAGSGWPLPERADRLLGISAFLDAGTVSRLAAAAPDVMLLSRPETFDCLGAASFPVAARLFTLQRAAEVPVGDDQAEPVQVSGERSGMPDGLHAKTFIAESGGRAVVLTGSANATRGGFGGNVEFDVVLEGPVASCGISAAWEGAKEAPGLSRLVEPYLISEPAGSIDPVAETEILIDRFHARLAAASLRLSVELQADNTATLTLQPPGVDSPGSTSCWPISLPGEIHAAELASADGPRWGPISVRNISRFLAVETTAGDGPARCTRTAVLTVELIGDVADRRQAALADVLRNRQDLLRYLIFLLGDPALDGILDLPGGERNRRPGGGFGDAAELALFEPLLKAVARGDDSLERIADLMADVNNLDGAADLIPEGFDDIWQVVWQVHREARDG